MGRFAQASFHPHSGRRARPINAKNLERIVADKLFAALDELVAQVRGECPSLLNEDSGGDGDLSIEIDEALDVYRKELSHV